MITYLDSSALIKLVRDEPDGLAMKRWLRSHARKHRLVTSELSRIEITRTLVRHGITEVEIDSALRDAFARVNQIELSRQVLADAMACRIRQLGTLDALHLATAQAFENELRTFVTYDKELAAAAAGEGYVVVAPN